MPVTHHSYSHSCIASTLNDLFRLVQWEFMFLLGQPFHSFFSSKMLINVHNNNQPLFLFVFCIYRYLLPNRATFRSLVYQKARSPSHEEKSSCLSTSSYDVLQMLALTSFFSVLWLTCKTIQRPFLTAERIQKYLQKTLHIKKNNTRSPPLWCDSDAKLF